MRTIQQLLDKEKIVNNDIRFINAHPELINQLRELVPWALTKNPSELLYLVRNKLSSYPVCKTCGKSLSESFINSVKGYRRWCSRSCYKLSTEWKTQIAKVSQAKYGTDHPLSSAIVQQKRKKTNLEKYGSANPMFWSGDLFKERMLKRYGATNSRHVPEINEKILGSITTKNQEMFKQKLATHLEQLEIYPLEQIDLSERFKPIKFKHSCGKEITSSLDKVYKIRCFDCHRPKNLSIFQHEVESYIASLINYDVKRNDRTKIAPYELDIFVPELNFAVEAHGDYWHTDLYVEPTAHQAKAALCDANGIQLIQIFESEWRSKPDIIKSILAAKLQQVPQTFNARELSLVEVFTEDEIKFFNETHLQGYARSAICLGLVHNGKFVSMMSFDKPRFNRRVDWEMIRFSNLPFTRVNGGAGKLLASFMRSHQGCGTLLTYADRRFSNGNLYKKLGFTLQGVTAPNYWYVNFKKNIKLSRYQAQKKKLKNLLGENFIEQLSESENMILNGYRTIFDAGNLIFTINL
jgi:hypothetical protein